MSNVKEKIIKKVAGQCKKLYENKAALAKLRRGIGKEIGELPEILGYVLLEEDAVSIKPTKAEKAVYTAMTLFALHQQGQSKLMHDSRFIEGTKRSASFGFAAKKLVTDDTATTFDHRFKQVATAADLEELAVHARSLINMMRQHDIAFDYAKFAYDLYLFQNTEWRKDVVVAWGKDYYLNRGKDE